MNGNKNEKKQVKRRGIYKLFANGKARFMTMVMALSALMSISAFASDGTETTTSGFDAVIGSMDTLGTLMQKVWTLMTSNALLTLFLAVALLGVGVSVFRMIKRAAHK